MTNRLTNRPWPFETDHSVPREGGGEDSKDSPLFNNSHHPDRQHRWLLRYRLLHHQATISYQRPAMTKTPMPALTTIQRPPSPAKIQKQSQYSEPVLTSSLIANQPEPMTISPEDPADLNITFSNTSSTFDLETAQIRCDKKLTTEKLDMYNFKKLISTLRLASRVPIRPGTEEATTKFRWHWPSGVLRHIRRGTLLFHNERSTQPPPLWAMVELHR